MIEPLGNNTVIKLPRRQEKTETGIYLVEDDSVRMEGVVVSTKLEGLSEGDRVVFSPYGAREITVGGDDYVIAEEERILGKIHDK